MENKNNTEIGAIVDSAMDLMISKTIESNTMFAKAYMKPKHTLDF